MDRVDFKFGEKKYVCISVTSCSREMFEIASAKYSLRIGSEIEASGICEINQKSDDEVILTAIVQPQRNQTLYRLEITYEIPPEILMHEVMINVY